MLDPETYTFDKFPVRFIADGNEYFVLARDLSAIFGEVDTARGCTNVDADNYIKKKLKLTNREASYIMLTRKGVEKYCITKHRHHANLATRLQTELTAFFAELNQPHTMKDYICNESWIITQCASQLVDSAGMPLPNPQPDIRKCIFPNQMDVIENPESCKAAIIERLAIVWLSETYPFTRVDYRDEREIRYMHIYSKKIPLTFDSGKSPSFNRSNRNTKSK
jgi:hypothetical protein